jgi:hypothetical protein
MAAGHSDMGLSCNSCVAAENPEIEDRFVPLVKTILSGKNYNFNATLIVFRTKI